MTAEAKELTDAEVMAREKLAFEADPMALIQHQYLKIRDKEANLVPLVENSTQKRINDKIRERHAAGRPAMILIVKARQLGVSTDAQALTFCFTSQRPFITALDIADDVDGASYIFKMNELYYENMAKENPHLTPAKQRSDEKRLEFEKTGSRIMIDTARNATAGRKFTCQIIHLSEAAFFPNFKETMQALVPSFSRTPDSIFIIETTANGINDFSTFYWKQKAAYEADPLNTDWIVMFCSWKEHREYSREFYNEGLRSKFMASLSTKELKIQKEHGLTLEQLNWRRTMIEDAFGGDDEKFEVEYPLTDKEAFKSTAKQVFPEKLLGPQRVNILVPKLRGEMELVDRRPSFMSDQSGFLKIYQESQPEERYVIGADTCESSLTHDEACAQVIKRSTWTQVAHLHGHMNPEDFAERLIALGLYYNRALLCPERNGPGLVTVTYLANRHYPNICKQKKAVVSDNGQWTETEEYGFHTNVKTKPIIIDNLQTSLRTLLLVLHDIKTLEELESYVVQRVNQEGHVVMGADEGKRDDCCMALAIAVYYAHQLPGQMSTLGSARHSMPRSRTGY
jgi:hypothetical protein